MTEINRLHTYSKRLHLKMYETASSLKNKTVVTEWKKNRGKTFLNNNSM